MDIQMGESGLSFRTTKDIDIVIKVEALNDDFVSALWNFIARGKYKNIQKSTGKKLFYRFYEPQDASYPCMIELFSRTPDSIRIPSGKTFTPIPVGEDLSSLSAILLDPDYYSIMKVGMIELRGLPLVSADYLIPLKAKAFLDLTALKASGASIDEKDIKKHKNDVFRLMQLITPATPVKLPNAIKVDLGRFLEVVREKPVDLGQIQVQGLSFAEALEILEKKYEL
jgi:hypothetical protein